MCRDEVRADAGKWMPRPEGTLHPAASRSPPPCPRGATARKAPKREPMPSSASTSTRAQRRRSSLRPNPTTRLPQPGKAPVCSTWQQLHKGAVPTAMGGRRDEAARAYSEHAREQRDVEDEQHGPATRPPPGRSRLNHTHCKSARLADWAGPTKLSHRRALHAERRARCLRMRFED